MSDRIVIDPSLLGNPYFNNIILNLYSSGAEPIISSTLKEMLFAQKSNEIDGLEELINDFSIDKNIANINVEYLIQKGMKSEIAPLLSTFKDQASFLLQDHIETVFQDTYEAYIDWFEESYGSTESNVIMQHLFCKNGFPRATRLSC
jgi:hypothetical protein